MIAIPALTPAALAVMGQRLALNVANYGFKVSVFNRTTGVMKDFVAANPDTPGCLVECESLAGVLSRSQKAAQSRLGDATTVSHVNALSNLT